MKLIFWETIVFLLFTLQLQFLPLTILPTNWLSLVTVFKKVLGIKYNLNYYIDL